MEGDKHLTEPKPEPETESHVACHQWRDSACCTPEFTQQLAEVELQDNVKLMQCRTTFLACLFRFLMPSKHSIHHSFACRPILQILTDSIGTDVGNSRVVVNSSSLILNAFTGTTNNDNYLTCG